MVAIRALTGPSSFALHSRQLQSRMSSVVRRSSSVTPPKPRLLARPDRFNPPSHGQRIKTAKPKQYGAPLSPEARAQQKRTKYPHMFPPEGTWMFWILTTPMLHLCITLGILGSLCVAIWYQNFIYTTAYKELLPPNSLFFAHPYEFVRQYVEVYGMHTHYNTRTVMERRRDIVDDVSKRAEYRRAHGLDKAAQEGQFGGWTAKTDAEVLGSGLGKVEAENVTGRNPAKIERVTLDPSTVFNAESETDTEPDRKKWLGIW